MLPTDFGCNTSKVKVAVIFNVDSQCVNIVRSVTIVWFGPAFSNLIKTFVIWSRCSFLFKGQWGKGRGHSDLQHRLPVCLHCPIIN